jgi:hypothetical protein
MSSYVREQRRRMTKRTSVTEHWPAFDAPLLQDVATAFARRRKAITYSTDLSCTRESDESDSEVFERLNFDLGSGRPGESNLRLTVWADGVMWLRLCVGAFGRNAGWAFIDHFHGEARDVSAEALVGMVEATLALRIGDDPASERQQLRAIWAPIHPYQG